MFIWSLNNVVGFPSGSVVKNPPAMQEMLETLVPWAGKFSGEGDGNPHQYSCLGNPMDIIAWQATVHGVPKELGHNLVTKQQQKIPLMLGLSETFISNIFFLSL